MTTLLVLAAASLADVMPRLAQSWPSSATVHVEFSFDSSARLAMQVERGAPADALVTADSASLERLRQGGKLVSERAARELAGNRLVLAVPLTSASVAKPADLAKPEVRRLALAGEFVPAGRYARQALEHDGLWKTLEPKIVRADNVRGALRWAAAGEADAALVYATDVAVEPKLKAAFVWPAGSHDPIVYPAAVVAGSKHAAAAASFLDFCAGAAARPIWKAAGFAPARGGGR